MRRWGSVAAVSMFVLGVLLRLGLYWANPPVNAFDNHFQPIQIIMDSGEIPAKDACWQCYHPPVFYWISAMVGNTAKDAGFEGESLLKVMQFLPCLYGVLTLIVVYLVLRKLPFSSFARLIAFGTVCFLPRHIYMSAMNSNDTISYFFVALSVYFLLVAIERKLPWWSLIATTLAVSIALFTKYTAFALLLAIPAAFVQLLLRPPAIARWRVAVSFLFVLLLPAVLLGQYVTDNREQYGTALPSNIHFLDPSQSQPRDSQVNFVSFSPWKDPSPPIISPGRMHSFWTLIYNGMWFDNEPKFLYFLDKNPAWWGRYYAWLRGEVPFPGENPATSRWIKFEASSLITLGLFPFVLVVLGLCLCFSREGIAWVRGNRADRAKLSIFPVLLAGNAAGIVALTLRLPVYSAMKASYFLNSLPALAVFLGLGLVPFERFATFRWVAGLVFLVLYTVATVHIVHVCWGLMLRLAGSG